MRSLTALVLSACALGCANQQPAPASAPPAHVQQLPGPTVRLQSSVRVKWTEVSRTPTSAVVVAEVERVNAVPVPLLLRVELPAGVTAKAGRAAVELPANPEAVTVRETYEFAFAATPADDVVLRVDGDSEGLGFHFQVPYRFGRPAPVGPTPAATGPAFQKGGKSFGATIPLGDAPPQPE